MLDGTRLDPYCEADEWHARRELRAEEREQDQRFGTPVTATDV